MHKPLGTLLALKVLSLIPDLNVSDRRVAATIIESYNNRTERCDPGLERIASLLNISKRTVIRSTQRLQAAGVVNKIRHGGYGHRNRYEPAWQKFAELEAAWRVRFNGHSKSRAPKVSPLPGPDRHFDGDTRVAQTYLTNRSNLTSSKRHSEGSNSSKRFASDVVTDPGNYRNAPRSAEAGRLAAQLRWDGDLIRWFAQTGHYATILEEIDSQLARQATEAEFKCRGSGAELVIAELRRRGHALAALAVGAPR